MYLHTNKGWNLFLKKGAIYFCAFFCFVFVFYFFELGGGGDRDMFQNVLGEKSVHVDVGTLA